jgi:hypothetical protein
MFSLTLSKKVPSIQHEGSSQKEVVQNNLKKKTQKKFDTCKIRFVLYVDSFLLFYFVLFNFLSHFLLVPSMPTNDAL